MSEMRNPLGWPVVNGELTCPECGAPAVEEQVPGGAGPTAAYQVRCTVCWRVQTTDPTGGRAREQRPECDGCGKHKDRLVPVEGKRLCWECTEAYLDDKVGDFNAAYYGERYRTARGNDLPVTPRRA